MSASRIQHDTVQLWCIHGNLQLPDVWKGFDGKLSLPSSPDFSESTALACVIEDLYKTRAQDFWDWAATFCRKVRQKSAGAPQFLMGYSMGGRLALHALLEDPKLWKAVIVIGADIGISDSAERGSCLRNDQKWAERFQTEPLEKLFSEWDSQGVFAGQTNQAPRQVELFDRQAISRLFDLFSKGRQNFLLPRLANLDAPPILFVSGSSDAKYSELGRKLSSLCPSVSHAVVPQAGHRVPWENPKDFITIIQDFINLVGSSS